MCREKAGKHENHKLAVVLREVGESPLCQNLLRLTFPRKRSLPTFASPFIGTGDAVEQLRTYRMTLTQWDHYDMVLCKFFPASLKDESLLWYNNLHKGPVQSFDHHLSELFLETYIHNSRIRPEVDALFQISRGTNVSLRSLVTRWRKLCAGIGNVPEDYATLGFKNSLRKTDPLFVRMHEGMPKNLGKLRVIQEDYVALEELQDGTYNKMVKGTNVVEPQNLPSQEAGRSNGGPTQFDKHRTGGWEGRDQTQQKKGKFIDPVYRNLNTPISEILKKIDGQHTITYPWNRGQQPERTKNRSDFCEFHQFHSHTTDSCRDLKKVLQDMVNEGKMQEYVVQPAAPPTTEAPILRVEIPREAQYLGCNTISRSEITSPV
ncbi:uncharacterized protein LOC113316354 [Papaver somniferum]|uniref:uncharacterized protein LOC113316354 n=1 Tax=Papaver somniferum TaxID=3469 RepID=UPI000E6F4A25|nr:uncharacterized protein LOC113316354 [Papaver somniferum]